MSKKSAISKVLVIWAICQILVLFLVCKEALDNASWINIGGLLLLYMLLWLLYNYILIEINNTIKEYNKKLKTLTEGDAKEIHCV